MVEKVNVTKESNEELSVIVDHLDIGFPIEKKHIVKDVSFKVRKGEINGFLGISGAGKLQLIEFLHVKFQISSGEET